MLQHLKLAMIAGVMVCSASLAARAADAPTANDTARFLAGMPVSTDSPLAALTNDLAWRQHAKFFDTAFGKLEQRQISRIRTWTQANLPTPRPTMFYMFSGPDFLYADAFYPKATTYVLSALEPVGAVPDLTKLPRGTVAAALRNVEYSLGSILSFSFFITKHMKSDLRAGQINGALPLLYVFLARSGKTIREVTPVKLDEQGVEHVASDAALGRNAAQGVKIAFTDDSGAAKTLYYFSTNLADDGFSLTGFPKFCEKLAPGDSLIKSASYLLHSGGFSKVRDFIAANSAVVVQDDSGIPLRHFGKDKWQFSPFGRYHAPLGIFPGTYQKDYAELFKASRPMDFGIGYRWRPNESNLLLAIKKP